MTIYDIIKAKLEKFPAFRERSNRAKYLSILSLRDLGLEQKFAGDEGLTMEELAKFALKFASYDRGWRYVLQDYESLRGSDYLDKVELEEKEKERLGY